MQFPWIMINRPIASNQLGRFTFAKSTQSRGADDVIQSIMLSVLWLALGLLLRIFRNRQDLIFENFVLRQQLTVLKRRRPRPALNLFDKFFWVAISRLWALDRKLSARTVGSRHCCERTPFEETSLRLHSLSPRGPHASRTREGNSGGEDLFRKRRGALFLTIDSVDCIIDTTGLPKAISLR
jgi:hypothetical protein